MGESDVRSTLLTHVLHGAQKQKCGAKVKVRCGEACSTNWTTLVRTYGHTRVQYETMTGRRRCVRLRQVAAAQMTSAAPARTRIKWLRFAEVRTRPRAREELDRLVRVLGVTRAGGASELQLGGYELLEQLWGRRATLTDKRTREHAEQRLCGVAIKGWGVSLRARPTLRVPGDPGFPMQCAKRAADTLFDALGCGGRAQVARLRRRVRIVRKKPEQVGEQLTNWRKWCADEYVPGVEPECV